MGNVYKDRYGIPGDSVKHLIRKFYRYLSDSDWHNADDFVRWCSQNSWEKGLRLCRNDTSLPHGPANSFFKKPEMTVRLRQADIRRRKEERKNLVSDFCKGCQKACPAKGSDGCDEWKEYFKQNWDKNICVAPKKLVPAVQEGSMVFRYEHPDLVREGIVFEASR